MRPRRLRLAAAILIVALVAAWLSAPFLVSATLRRAAAARGLTLRWERLRLRLPSRAELRGVTISRAERGDTLFTADSLAAALDPWSLVLLRPRLAEAAIARARVTLVPGRAGAPDTLAPEDEEGAAASPRGEKLRRTAEALVRLLLAPARRAPRLEIRDLAVQAAAGEAAPRGGRVDWLALDHAAAGMHLLARGALALGTDAPFDLELTYGHDDRLVGGAVLRLLDPVAGAAETLRLSVDGRLTQDRHAGVLRLADSTRLVLGRVPLRLGGALDRHGPRLAARLAADGVTEDAVRASVPASVLGPLTRLRVRGSFDYRLALDLDLAHPDSARCTADVVPHGLALDPALDGLELGRLGQPFLAVVRLPRGRLVPRELSPLNPFYRPLEAVDSLLVHAVLTNEDGGFYHHRGFNTEAIQLAIAANVKAGAWRRGAGTVTMQLARNLWLGHERTLARKAQEVVLAWVLEHLTGVPKRRLLEIYLNVIEWGPGIHGAAEATRYYFDADPGRVTVDEALFLATVVPSPVKWRYRFAPDGSLRDFERAQMHFIGRAMVAKGWLAPEMLPPRDSLAVTLRGPARVELFPPDTAAADSAGPPLPVPAGPDA
jgi:hypothetical protein